MTLPGHLLYDRHVLESVSRRESRAVFIGEGTVLCRVLGSYFLYAEAEDVGIAPHFALNGYWEANVTLALARAVKPGSWCLDVGANHGYYTLVLAGGTGPGGHVTAIEPNPRSIELMRRTLEVNGFLGYVDIVSNAVTDKPGDEVSFYIPPHRGMNALIVEAGAADPAGATIQATTETIDGLTQGWPRVDVVKIDVEGAEEAVWRGMQRVLTENPEITVVLEVNAARYENPDALLGEIESAGFGLRYIDMDGEPRRVERAAVTGTSRDWMLYLKRDPS